MVACIKRRTQWSKDLQEEGSRQGKRGSGDEGRK